jgi:hypothetical protein
MLMFSKSDPCIVLKKNNTPPNRGKLHDRYDGHDAGKGQVAPQKLYNSGF